MPARDPTSGRFVGGGGGGEIDRMLVRLMGDGSSYFAMLNKAQAVTARAAATMQRVGRSMTMYVTAPLVAIGALGAKSFASFDQAMVESTSIMKVTEAQINSMREAAVDLTFAGRGPQGITELAKSYFYLASAGKDAEQSMALLPKVMDFATAGAFDMALATDLLTDAQSALGLSSKNVAEDTKNMARVSDVLVKANTLANASVQQFSTALTSKAGAALKVYNKDVEEGVAVLAAMADQGMKAELAGNALDRIIRLMSKAQLDNTAALAKYNVRVFDAQGSMRNLGDIIADLERAFKHLSDEERSAALAAMGFEARVQGVILPLLGTSDAIKRYERELRKAGGTTRDVAEKQMKSFSNQMKVLWNQATIMAAEIGQVLAPALMKLGKHVKAGIEGWRGLDQHTKTVIVTVGALMLAIGPLLIGLAGLLKIVGAIIVAVKLLSAAILFLGLNPLAVLTVAVGLLIWKFYEARKVVTELAGGIEEAAKSGQALRKEHMNMIRELGALNKQQFLSNAEHARARQIVSELESIYGDLGLTVDIATGKVLGLARGQWNLNEAMAAGKLAEMQMELMDLTKQYNEALQAYDKYVKAEREGWLITDKWQRHAQIIEETQTKIRVLTGAMKGLQAIAGRKWVPEGLLTGTPAPTAPPGARDVTGVAARAGAQAERRTKAIEKEIKSLQKYQGVIEQGRRIIERYLTPQERFVKQVTDLGRLREAGALGRGAAGEETYRRAVEGARKEMEEALKITKEVQAARVGDIGLAGRGTAEAASRLLESQATRARRALEKTAPKIRVELTPKALPGLAGIDESNKLLAKIEAHMDKLVELEEEKPEIELEAADL